MRNVIETSPPCSLRRSRRRGQLILRRGLCSRGGEGRALLNGAGARIRLDSSSRCDSGFSIRRRSRRRAHARLRRHDGHPRIGMWRGAHVPCVSYCTVLGKSPGNCMENPPSSRPYRDWAACFGGGRILVRTGLGCLPSGKPDLGRRPTCPHAAPPHASASRTCSKERSATCRRRSKHEPASVLATTMAGDGMVTISQSSRWAKWGS